MKMKSFNVINFDINHNVFESYDVIPYLVNAYKETTKNDRPKTYNEFKNFVKDESMYMFWGRCEYEILLVDWPCKKISEKWDIYKQIMMNLDIITSIVMDEVTSKKVNK